MNNASITEWLPGVPDRHEGGILWVAFGLAVLVHFGVFLVQLPEMTSPVPQNDGHRYIVVKKYTHPLPGWKRNR